MSEDVRIYNRVATLRKQRKISRKELAAAVDLGDQTMGYIELHDYDGIELGTALRIALALGAPLEDVFSIAPFTPEDETLEAGEARIVEALSSYREAPMDYLARATGLTDSAVEERLGRLEHSGRVTTREVTEQHGLFRKRTDRRLFAALANRR